MKRGLARQATARDALVERVGAALARKRSVALVGPVGVGKSAIVNAVAARGGASFASLRRLTTATFLSGTKWLGELETRTSNIIKEISTNNLVVHVVDALNLRTAGNTSNNPRTVFDQLKPELERGAVRLVIELTAEERHKLGAHRSLLEAFEVIEVPPLPREVIEGLVDAEATRLQVPLTPETRAELLSLPTRFLGAGALPGNAFELLAHVARAASEQRARGEAVPVDAAFVASVFSGVTGLPRFVVSSTETLSVKQVRAFFGERLVGQRDAIDAVVETITLFKAGLQDPDRAIGTFLFVGPTGVGKTELARCLAEFVFGSVQRLLRFDLSEFADWDGFMRLIGDPKRPEQPARLIDPVRAQPFQVILLDEIEKAHTNVWDLLLPLLDEGRLTSAQGDTVDFRRTIIIATSNAGAARAEKHLGFADVPAGEGLAEVPTPRQAGKIREALEQTFRPELLNRFQHIIVFHPLSRAQLRIVARREVSRVLSRDGIARARVVVDVSDAAIDLALERGFDSKYGARALKREVQRTLVLPLAQRLAERSIAPGSVVQLDVRAGALAVRVVETQATRAHAREQRPVKDELGAAVSLEALVLRVEALSAELERLHAVPSLNEVKKRLGQFSRERFLPDFWKDPVKAAELEAELERLSAAMGRLATLGEQCAAVRARLLQSRARKAVEASASEVVALERLVRVAGREVSSLGASGQLDAVVRVRPLGPEGARARDRLVEVYRAWAQSRHAEVELLAEPLGPDDVVLLSVVGPFAWLYLAKEVGLHRFGKDDDAKVVAAVAEVQVAPLDARAEVVQVLEQRATKQTGVYGGRVRSVLVVEAGERQFTLAGDRTLQQAKELAPVIAAALRQAHVSEEIVRRYDGVDGKGFRDALTGLQSGRHDALTPERLQALLEARVDH